MGLISFEAAATAVVERLVPGDAATRAEITETSRQATERATFARKLRELGGLVGLGLRLRSRRATGDRPAQIIAQGADLGATLVLSGIATWAWLATSDGPPSTVVLTTGAACSLLIAAVVADRRALRAAIIAAACLVLSVASGPSMPIVAGFIVSVGLLSVGRTSTQRLVPARKFAQTVAVGVAVLAAAEAALGSRPPAETLVLLAAIGPIVLVAAGWFDPRLAVAATSVWLWRLAAVDLIELTASVRDVGDGLTVDGLVIRWLMMSASVIAGGLITATSTRRAASP
jgi:hypothetical protein